MVTTTDARGLLSKSKWSTDTVTYSFPDSKTDYESGYSETSNFVAFSSAERQAFSSVITQVMNFSELTLTEATPDSTAQIRIAKTNTTGADAWAYYPGTGKGGDVWFNTNPTSDTYGGKGGMNWSAMQPGDYSYTVFMHEFGHSLGLKHSFEKGGVAGSVPKQYDSLEYTVMAYDAYQTVPYNKTIDSRDWWADNGNNPQTFMVLDIAALQTMYGADYLFNATPTVYKWNQYGGYSTDGGVTYVDLNSNTSVIFMTIWDGGGLDVYDFSNYSVGMKINLTPGEWCTIDYANTVNPLQRADLLAGDSVYWATGNIANALMYNNNTASLIENAIGGTGNDILIGNQVANRLEGGNGNDTFYGGLGADILIGGAGNDVFVFDTVLGSTNIDRIDGFSAGGDAIWLSKSIFGALTTGALPSSAFVTGTRALDTDDRIIFNSSNGALFYDADGSGTRSAPVQFATVVGLTSTLAASDFLIV